MVNVIIPMAGNGSRFLNSGFDTPKPLIQVKGKTLIEHSIDTLGIGDNFIFITKLFSNHIYNEELTQIFLKSTKNFTEVRVEEKQFGAAHSALFAAQHVSMDDELIITNCDQYLEWNSDDFISTVRKQDVDGAIVLYKSTNPKNSFAIISNDLITAVAEKQPISDNALIGVHYWKKAKDFFDSANELFLDFKNQGYPECYVSVTYNYMIKNNKKIIPYFTDGYHSLGTPEDLKTFSDIMI